MSRHLIDKSGEPVSREMRAAFLKLDKAKRPHPTVRKAHARATSRSDDGRLRQFLRIAREAES